MKQTKYYPSGYFSRKLGFASKEAEPDHINFDAAKVVYRCFMIIANV